MSRIQPWSSGSIGLGHICFSRTAIPSTRTSSHRLRLARATSQLLASFANLHFWNAQYTGITTELDYGFATISPSSSSWTLPHGTKSQLFSITPSLLRLLLQHSLHIHQWPLLASYNVKPQHLSGTPSNPASVSLTTPVPPVKLLRIPKGSNQPGRQLWFPLDDSFCVLTLKMFFPRYCKSMILTYS